MNWYQHLFVSLACCHAVLFLFHVSWSGPLLAAAALGAWLPDVDHEKTRIFKFSLAVVFALSFSFAYSSSAFWWPLLGSSFSSSWKWLGSLVFALALSLSWFFVKPGHRGLMHHPAVGLFLAVVLGLLGGSFWTGVITAVAFGSHLGADRFWDAVH